MRLASNSDERIESRSAICSARILSLIIEHKLDKLVSEEVSSFDKYRAYDIQGNRRPTPCIFIVLATPPKIVRIHTLLGHNGGVEGFDDLISWEETLAGKLGWEVARDVNEIERTGKNLPVSCWAPLALFFFLPISIIWEVESRSNQDCASARLKRCSRMLLQLFNRGWRTIFQDMSTLQ